MIWFIQAFPLIITIISLFLILFMSIFPANETSLRIVYRLLVSLTIIGMIWIVLWLRSGVMLALAS